MRRFADKVAMVTGAASGIGRATAQRLAEEGARVFACDINAVQLRQHVDALRDAGLEVRAHVFDVRDSGACRAAVQQAVTAYGGLDVLCNIAGVALFKALPEITEEAWDDIVAVNLTSIFVLSQAAMPQLLARKGNIVNVASTAGIVGVPYSPAYSATKGGVLLFTKSLAAEYTRRGVRVNAICPGGVNTPLIQGFALPEGADMDLVGRVMPLTPFNAEPEEIAAAIAYIASDEARFMSGTGFVIDGGQTAI
jgi:meso-butanediol dehydrogenase / (S,S)-butanediol dehydrogenase / diacetyl reductase